MAMSFIRSGVFWQLGISLIIGLISAPVWAEGESTNVSTGVTSGSILGNNNQHASNTGVAVNGNVTGGNLNNNQNSNTNVLQPIVLTQPQYMSSGQGGSSTLVLPRNPLPLSNAALGRSNFGLQFGVQNNPGISMMTNGKENGLGWFMQGGVTIPFGKIPNVANNGKSQEYDNMRQDRIDDQRRVFAEPMPSPSGQSREARIEGKVVGLNAYNYATIPSQKLQLQGPPDIGEISQPRPKVLALLTTSAYDQPLNTGSKIGQILTGKEYPYLGHTRSGWIKVLLPTGQEGWTTGQFEYVKFDYTEIDTLAASKSTLQTARAGSHRMASSQTKNRQY